MNDFLVAIGLAMVIEGCLYAVLPGAMRKGLQSILSTPDLQLRVGGTVVTAAGVALVWLIRH
jgi:uncharacterized protein YjeT (DUF2065 family)